MFSRFISCRQNFLIQVSKFYLGHCRSKSIKKIHGFRAIFSDNGISVRPTQPTILYWKSSEMAFLQHFVDLCKIPLTELPENSP